MRRWKYRSGATYVSELAQTLPEGGAGRVEDIESLQWIKRGAKK